MAQSAAKKLAAVTSVQEPPDVNYKIDPAIWTYAKGSSRTPLDLWNFRPQIIDMRLDLAVIQASSVEIDLEDTDFQVLSDPLFCNWAWDIKDVSLSSQKKFKTTTLRNSTDTAYLGDQADLKWVLGAKPIDFEIGRVFFRLSALQAQQTTVTLTFEDRVASLLRDQSGSLSWDRSKHTRAQFVAMLCRQAGVDYFIPEIDVLQPVEVDVTTTNSSSTPATGSALAASANLTLAGIPLTKSQRDTASGILGVAAQMNAPTNASIGMVYAAMGETNLNPKAGGGLFQSGPGVNSGGSSAFSNGTDYLGAARGFLSGGSPFGSPGAIAAANRGDPPWQIANETELNHVWITSRQDSYAGPGRGTIAEATAIVAAYGGPGAVASTSTSTQTGAYTFSRGPNEDSWDCIQRLASEVGWYAFARQNKLWFVSGNYIFAQSAQITAEIGKQGVQFIDLDLDTGERDQIAQCDVYAKTDLWAALPGMCMGIVNRGPATGKWFVSQAQSSPLDPTKNDQITLYKPIPKRAEPAATAGTSGTTPSGVVGDGGPGTPGGALWAAQKLSDKKLQYTQAQRTLVPLDQISQGETLYDCSASVSWVLLRGGFPLPGGATWGSGAPVSGDFTAGQAGLLAGPGQQMTIWANSQHMFIEFNIPGSPHSQGNTVNPNGGGFGLFSWSQPGTGGWGGPNPGQGAPTFYPVHYPGT